MPAPYDTYIAKRRLDKALAQHHNAEQAGGGPPKVRFTLRFLPFELHPDLPSGQGRDRWAWERDALHGGDEDGLERYAAQMRAKGQAEGIPFRLDRDAGQAVANTLEAHRVVQRVQQQQQEDGGGGAERAGRLVDALYRAYFEEGRNPSSEETLVGACVEAGLDGAEARRLVVEDKEDGLVEVKSAVQAQRMNGFDSVPTVLFEGRRRDLTLVGAKTVEQYVKALLTIVKESS